VRLGGGEAEKAAGGAAPELVVEEVDGVVRRALEERSQQLLEHREDLRTLVVNGKEGRRGERREGGCVA